MNEMILYEDQVMLVVIKPSQMPTQPDKTGDEDLLSLLETHCKQKLYLVHRLDRPVGGILVVGKTKEAQTHFTKEMEKGKLEKKYRAVLLGKMEEKKGLFIDYLKKEGRTNTSKVVSSSDKEGKKAILTYEVLEEMQMEERTLNLVEIQLETGRHHQIRVQTAYHQTPIWGDKKYNPENNRNEEQIGLWAYALKGTHPITKKIWEFTAIPCGIPFQYFSGNGKNKLCNFK